MKKKLLAFFLNRAITLIRIWAPEAPIARLFLAPLLKSLFVKCIARLLDFGPRGHPSHGTCIARFKKNASRGVLAIELLELLSQPWRVFGIEKLDITFPEIGT